MSKQYNALNTANIYRIPTVPLSILECKYAILHYLVYYLKVLIKCVEKVAQEGYQEWYQIDNIIGNDETDKLEFPIDGIVEVKMMCTEEYNLFYEKDLQFKPYVYIHTDLMNVLDDSLYGDNIEEEYYLINKTILNDRIIKLLHEKFSDEIKGIESEELEDIVYEYFYDFYDLYIDYGVYEF